MNEILDEVLKALIAASVPVILTLAGMVAQKIWAWVEAHTTAKWLRMAKDEAESVVTGVWQTSVKGLKEKATAGTITQADLRASLEMALNDAQKQLVERLRKFPEKLKPDLVNSANSLLESAIGKLKEQGYLKTDAALKIVPLPTIEAINKALQNPPISPESK